jgi:hypothetical protein
MQLYHVTTLAKKYSGCKNVEFKWFRCERRAPRSYADLIQNYDPHDRYAKDCIDEMFELDEAQALKDYIDQNYGDAGITTIEKAKLPIANNTWAIGEIPGGLGFYELDKAPNYSLPFKVWGSAGYITKQKKQMEKTTECSICKPGECKGYFGLCPVCHETDGYANSGRAHRFYCKKHKTSWCVGSNLFSSWRGQTEAEQRAIWDEIGLNDSEDVEPYFPPGCIAFAAAELVCQAPKPETANSYADTY